MRIGTLADVRRAILRRPPLISPAPQLGPELLVNGGFDAGQSPWTVAGSDATHIATFSGGTLRYQSDTTSPQLNVVQSNILTVGKLYEVTVVVSSRTSGSTKTDAFSPAMSFGITPGTYVYRGTSVATSFNITRGSTNVDMSFDSVSVREVLN